MTGIKIDCETGDLLTGVGGMSTGDTTQQNQYLILATHPGEWKENPLLGVGIGDYVNDNETDDIKHTIIEQFWMDGIAVNSMTVKQGEIRIDAEYKK